MGLTSLWDVVTSYRAVASYRLSLGVSLAAALINVPIGFLLAWVISRDTFIGRGLLDAVIDLPFALPTSVSGLALTSLYANTGWIGGVLSNFGIKVSYTWHGIVVALVFIGLPFVVRTVQPVIENLDREVEEAAATLGATRWQVFSKVTLPALIPATLTGAALAFARGLGEYGSVVFISGNMPFKTEITPLLIMTRLEEYDYMGSTALAATMLAMSFIMLFVLNKAQQRTRIRYGGF